MTPFVVFLDISQPHSIYILSDNLPLIQCRSSSLTAHYWLESKLKMRRKILLLLIVIVLDSSRGSKLLKHIWLWKFQKEESLYKAD